MVVAAPFAEKDIQLAFMSVANYLERVKRTKGLKRVSFDGVRKWVNGNYSDELLNVLLHEYPNTFRQVRLKGDKLGIALAFDNERLP